MIYRFATCQVNENNRTLSCGGRIAEIERRAYRLLVYLIRHRDRIVPKAELVEILWEGNSVSESALPRCMNALRSALSDPEKGDKDETIIETVYGVGYQFVAAIESSTIFEDVADSPKNSRTARQERITSLKAEIGQRRAIAHGVADLLLELASAETKQGCFDDARVNLFRIVTIARANQDGPLLGRAAIALANTYLAVHPNELLAELLLEAARSTDSSNSALCLELRSELQVARVPSTSLEDRSIEARKILADSAAITDRATRTRIRLRCQRAIDGPGTLEERREIIEESIMSADQIGETRLQIEACQASLTASLAAGDLSRFESDLERMRVFTHAIDENIWNARYGLSVSLLALMRGRFDLALHSRGEALSWISRSPEDFRLAQSATAFMIGRERPGLLSDALPIASLESLRDPLTLVAVAVASATLGFIEPAKQLFSDLRSGDLDFSNHNFTWNFIVALLSEVAYRLDDAEVARYAVSEIPESDAVMPSMNSYSCAEPMPYFLGLAHTTLKSWDAANRSFQEAAAICVAIDAPAFEARVSYAWASMLMREGKREKIGFIRTKAKLANKIAHNLGMDRLQAESAVLLDQISED